MPVPARCAPLLPHAAILLVVAFGTTWGISAKSALDVMPATDFLVFRYVLAISMLAIPFLLRRHFRRPGPHERRAFVIGLFDPGAATLLVFFALYYTTAVNAIVIASWLPLLSTIGAWWLIGEKPALPVLAGALLGLLGVVVLVSDDAASGGSIAGDLMCVACQVILAGSVALMRRINQEVGDPLRVATWQVAGGTLTVIVVSLIDAWINGRVWLAAPPLDGWFLIVYLAVFLTAGAFWLYNFALRYLPTARATLYGLLGPPLSVPLTALVLNERLTWIDLTALATVMVGVALPALAAVVRPKARS
ncbi:MAG: hypothetical protein EXQ91_08505 [Alphaproteobacteria bacterium]|nr:hypothetical protein [Alphaproteobacteria bacterium]